MSSKPVSHIIAPIAKDKCEEEEELEEEELEAKDEGPQVTVEVLQGWLLRAKKKYRNGVTILRVTSQGKLVRRTIYIGAKEEYFEITSGKLFMVAYHLSDINRVTPGCNSKAFKLLVESSPNRTPNPDKSCVVEIDSLPISFVFKTPSDRRDFIFLLRVEARQIQTYYDIKKKATSKPTNRRRSNNSG